MARGAKRYPARKGSQTLSGIQAEDSHELILGPADIRGMTDALDVLLPWLAQSKMVIAPDGHLDMTDPEASEAVTMLREATERFLPESIMGHLGVRSGLGWPNFFTHVVGWWLPQRKHVGFLRAFVDRARLHHVELRLHWKQGQRVEVLSLKPDNSVLVVGGSLGILSALVLQSGYYISGVLPCLLVAAAGLVVARIYQRVIRHRVCGEYLCQAPMGRSATCLSCGGQASDRRESMH